MTQLLHVVAGVSPFVKVGWVAWLAWAVAQTFWYRVVRDLPDLSEMPELAAGDASSDWQPVAHTRHTTLLGSTGFWEPAAAGVPSVSESEPAATNAAEDMPIVWGGLASDISPTQELVTTRRSPRRRRRAPMVSSSPTAA